MSRRCIKLSLRGETSVWYALKTSFRSVLLNLCVHFGLLTLHCSCGGIKLSLGGRIPHKFSATYQNFSSDLFYFIFVFVLVHCTHLFLQLRRPIIASPNSSNIFFTLLKKTKKQNTSPSFLVLLQLPFVTAFERLGLTVNFRRLAF